MKLVLERLEEIHQPRNGRSLFPLDNRLPEIAIGLFWSERAGPWDIICAPESETLNLMLKDGTRCTSPFMNGSRPTPPWASAMRLWAIDVWQSLCFYKKPDAASAFLLGHRSILFFDAFPEERAVLLPDPSLGGHDAMAEIDAVIALYPGLFGDPHA